MSQFFASGGQSIGVSTSTSVLPMNIKAWFHLGWLIGSPWSPRDSQKSSPTPQFKSINSSALFIFSFVSIALEDRPKRYCYNLCQRVFCLHSRSVKVSGLTFKSWIHFKFIFVYSVRKCSNLILLHVAVQFFQYNLLMRLFFSNNEKVLNCFKIIWTYLWFTKII